MWVSNIEFNKLVKRVEFLEQENESRVKQINIAVEGLVDKANKIQKEQLALLESVSNDNRRIHLKIDEYDRQLREDMERGFTGVVRTFDKRLESLGDKKGIVTDLLKKIARLEGDNVSS